MVPSSRVGVSTFPHGTGSQVGRAPHRQHFRFSQFGHQASSVTQALKLRLALLPTRASESPSSPGREVGGGGAGEGKGSAGICNRRMMLLLQCVVSESRALPGGGGQTVSLTLSNASSTVGYSHS